MKKKNSSVFMNTLRVFFARGPIVKICTIVVLLFFFAAIFAPVLTPYTETQQDLILLENLVLNIFLGQIV